MSTSITLSQTDVKGNLSENVTWEKAKSPYNVTENISVAKDVTLTIEPGVKINFAKYAKMTVNGKLLAEGTAQDSIIFTGNQWTGIFIEYQSNGGSKIKYARIANASSSWCPNGNCYGQIQLVNTELSNSNVYNIYNGISASNQSVLKFNEIHDMNNNRGLSLSGGSEAYGNVFYNSNSDYYSNNFFIYISGSDGVYDYETNQTIYGDYTSVFRGNKVYGIYSAIQVGQYSLVEKNNISYNVTSSQLASTGYKPIGIWSCGSQNSNSNANNLIEESVIKFLNNFFDLND